jgi:hypothetical protein
VKKFKPGDIVIYECISPNQYFLITEETYSHYYWFPLTPQAEGTLPFLHKIYAHMCRKVG